MKRMSALVLAFAFAVPVAARAAEVTERKKLAREETIELFGKLHAAVPGAKTFQAKLTRTEESGLIVDEEPLVYHGEVKMVRPDCFRQEITKPRRSLTVANEADVWIYFPDEREVQHIDLKKGMKDREDMSSRSIMPWITFDFEGLDKKFEITAVRVPAPEGLVVMKVPARPSGDTTPAEGAEGGGEEGGEEGVKKAPPAEPVALSSPYIHEITFVPRKAEYAPNMIELVLTVYGEEPWPFKIEQESEDDLIVTEFSVIILDAPVAEEVFKFKPPRGTKVVDLSG